VNKVLILVRRSGGAGCTRRDYPANIAALRSDVLPKKPVQGLENGRMAAQRRPFGEKGDGALQVDEPRIIVSRTGRHRLPAVQFCHARSQRLQVVRLKQAAKVQIAVRFGAGREAGARHGAEGYLRIG
jgi:hypothetical protein